MKCSKCNIEVSSILDSCPNCGANLNHRSVNSVKKASLNRQEGFPNKEVYHAEIKDYDRGDSEIVKLWKNGIVQPLKDANFYRRHGSNDERCGVWTIVIGLILYIISMVFMDVNFLVVPGLITVVYGCKRYTNNYRHKNIWLPLTLLSILVILVHIFAE